MALRDYKFTLVAGVSRSLNVVGNYFGVIQADGAVKIQFDEGGYLTRRVGMGGSAEYSRVAVLSETDQTITLALGTGTMYDARSSIIDPTFIVDLEVPNLSNITDDVTLPAGVTTQVLAPNIARRSASISSLPDNDSLLRVGCNDSVSANNGGVLNVGASAHIETQTGVWVYNSGDTTQIVSIVELEVGA